MTGPRIQLRLIFGSVSFGPGKAELLTLISTHGSIAAAGRAMGMSYKRAWDLVEEMNALFRAPVIVTTRGGAGKGGAVVTDTGLAVLAHYRRLVETLEREGAADLLAIATDLVSDTKTEGDLPPVTDTDMFSKT